MGVLPSAWLVQPAKADTGSESTFERVVRTKQLRIAAIPGNPPYFVKNAVSGGWSGAAIAMAQGIADIWQAEIVYVETTWGNSILDLQANKVDIGFALNPTPQRALSIGFTRPYINAPYGCLTKAGFVPKTWSDLNKPDIRVAFDYGSLHETCARRFTPNAQLTGLKTVDECLLALQSGRVDAQILATSIGLGVVGKNASLGPYHMLTGPLVALPSCYGIRRETDIRFVDVVNAWIDFNRGIGLIRQQMIDGLALNGVKPEQIPAEITF
jgi:polar amino acid transport system substrate-binding protein